MTTKLELEQAAEAYYKSVNNYLDTLERHDKERRQMVANFRRLSRLVDICCLLAIIGGVLVLIGVF